MNNLNQFAKEREAWGDQWKEKKVFKAKAKVKF